MTTADLCEGVVGAYLKELQKEFAITTVGHGCSIVTPFIRPDGEALEIMVELLAPGRFRLTDTGDTLGYLYTNGLTLSRSVLDSAKGICRRFGTSLEGAALVIQLEEQAEVGEAVHKLIQTMITATDLVQKRRPMERVNFDAEVESLIIVSGGVYDTDYVVLGRRSSHSIRFHVNANRKLLIQPLSAASEGVAFSWAERWGYRFNDIRERDTRWRCVAVLDDRGQRSQVWSDRALTPLSDYSVFWGDKAELSAMVANRG